MALRVTQIRGDRLFQHLGLDRLQHAGFLGTDQPAGIDGDQQIGGAVLALGLDTLDQLVGLGLDQIDLDAGLLGEILVERVVRIVMARGIDIHLGGLRQGWREAGSQRHEANAGAHRQLVKEHTHLANLLRPFITHRLRVTFTIL